MITEGADGRIFEVTTSGTRSVLSRRRDGVGPASRPSALGRLSIDLRVLCRTGLTLDAAYTSFERKYGTKHTDRYHRLRALAYFDDAEREPMPDMQFPFDWDEAKRFFTADATRLLAAATS